MPALTTATATATNHKFKVGDHLRIRDDVTEETLRRYYLYNAPREGIVGELRYYSGAVDPHVYRMNGGWAYPESMLEPVCKNLELRRQLAEKEVTTTNA